MVGKPRKTGVYDNANADERKGIPWWAWLLVALVILGLAWWFFAGSSQEAQAPTGQATEQPATGTAPPPATRP